MGVRAFERPRYTPYAMATDQSTTDAPVELPSDFAEHMAIISDLEAPPATLEEWWGGFDQYSEEGITIRLADLYSETPTRHEVRVDGRIRYTHCALDALEAAIIEDQSPVTVRSIDPVTGTPVMITISDESVEVSPEGALICFGSTIDPEDVKAAGSLAAWSVQDDKSEVKASVCQYTNTFESEATYEEWASQTESVTAPLPPKKVVPYLRDLPTESS